MVALPVVSMLFGTLNLYVCTLEQSLVKYLRENQRPSLSNFLGRLVELALDKPRYDLKNYLLFSIATMPDGSSYLGIFQNWFPLTGPAQYSSRSSQPGGTLQEAIDSAFQQAIQHKNARSFLQAADLFLDAAKKIQTEQQQESYQASQA